MNNVFNNNLLGLRHGNSIVATLAVLFSIFPLIFEETIKQGFVKAGIYAGIAVFALLMSFYANYIMQQMNVSKRIIFLLTVLFFTNILFFGTYVDIISKPDSIAAIFPCFLICALLLFINPPQLNLLLTISAMVIFIATALIMNMPHNPVYFIINTVVAGTLSLFFGWNITKLRLGLEISANDLEDERNKYVDQSITDELTQLRNRRDFNATFQRFLSNYRTSDEWLCVALSDIDHFKFYNDHYGHPKGDDCLRSIGAALNSLSALGVYAARVGGEEFALLWFEKDPSHVDKIVNQWTGTIRDLKILHEKSKVNDYVTMSIGIYIIRCGTHHDTQFLYDQADKALYSAKSSGRNCAVICGDEVKQYKIAPKDE
ncbi:MAG: GGDEF domain-containing protein [Treponema sp.]|nr:GGDEF domain-containing protein [Treponema sp.]